MIILMNSLLSNVNQLNLYHLSQAWKHSLRHLEIRILEDMNNVSYRSYYRKYTNHFLLLLTIDLLLLLILLVRTNYISNGTWHYEAMGTQTDRVRQIPGSGVVT